jgi:hypothetical protein
MSTHKLYMSQPAPLALIVLNFMQVVELKTFSTAPIGTLPGCSTFVFFVIISQLRQYR